MDDMRPRSVGSDVSVEWGEKRRRTEPEGPKILVITTDRKEVKTFAARLAHQRRVQMVYMEENPMKSKKARLLLEDARAGKFAVAWLRPPVGTFSRSRWKSGRGPPVTRSKAQPWGFKNLSAGHMHQVKVENSWVKLSVSLAAAQLKSNGLFLLEHPEDLGKTAAGEAPASIWQLEVVRALAKGSELETGVLRWSAFGEASPNPTRLLHNVPNLKDIYFDGWPAFDSLGMYTGPLNKYEAEPPLRVKGKKACIPDILQEVLADKLVEAAPLHAREGSAASSSTGGRERCLQKVLKAGMGEDFMKNPAEIIGTKVARARGRLSRRKLTKEDWEKLKNGVQTGEDELYVGRGGRGVPRSEWANPFLIGPHGDRDTVVQKFSEHLVKSGLKEKVGLLRGKTLLCHCSLQESCHADVLIRMAAESVADNEVTLVEDEGDAASDASWDDGLPERVGEVGGAMGTVPLGMPGPASAEVPWRGVGNPRRAWCMGRNRPFEDGGGLCSPGRWRPSQRRPPSLGIEPMVKELKNVYEEALKGMYGKADLTKFTLKLAAGQVLNNPFCGTVLDQARNVIKSSLNLDARQCEVADGQNHYLDMISMLFKKCGDPDWAIFGEMAQGVNLGVDDPLPRTPLVFEEKTKWKLEEYTGEDDRDRENYCSTEGFEDKVEELFREEERLGWMVNLSDEEAKQKYGDRLHVASLGVVDEGAKIRVVHDATHGVHVNHRIRPQDQLRCPGAGELHTLLTELRENDTKSFAVMGDASKAHRRIKIRPADWGYQACRTTAGRVWLNKVGTYGLGSAAYWWGRFASGVLVRLVHYLADDVGVEALLFADDFLWLALDREGVDLLGFFVFLLTALGVEFKWAKFRGGVEAPWIGYWVDLRGYKLGLSAKRAAWLVDWIGKRLVSGEVDMADFTAVLGRVSFALAPLLHLRPFAAPLYAWGAAVGHRGMMRLPWSVLFILRYIAVVLGGEGRMFTVLPRGEELGEAFRADAKAEGSSVWIGGWETIGGTRPRDARWFSVQLTRSSAPWAFARGQPFRTIAALELYATLVCVVLFGKRWRSATSGRLRLSGATDNLGNTMVMNKLMSSKFPLVIVLTELAAQLQAHNLDLHLQWVPRLQNEEADALTNQAYSDFDRKKRMEVDVTKLEWIVMNDMLKASEEIHETVMARKALVKEQGGRAGGRERKLKPEGRLRQRDPW